MSWSCTWRWLRVCWIRPSGEDFRVGFSFDPPLDHGVIEQLLRQGVMDRRRTSRDPIDRSATASWRLNPQPTPVTLVDLSRGGFCLSSPLSAEPHSRLRLQVTDANDEIVEATANVQWRLQIPEGYLLGCSLSSQETSALLRSALRPPHPQSNAPVVAASPAACCWRPRASPSHGSGCSKALRAAGCSIARKRRIRSGDSIPRLRIRRDLELV